MAHAPATFEFLDLAGVLLFSLPGEPDGDGQRVKIPATSPIAHSVRLRSGAGRILGEAQLLAGPHDDSGRLVVASQK